MTVSSAQARSLGPDAVAHFRLRGGTLGRSRDNDWILPDPERIVSGHHVRILYEQGAYYVEDTSANGTFLNQTDTPIGKGQPVALDHGDTLYIGDYVIQVELVEESLRSSSFAPNGGRSDPAGSAFVAKPYVPRTSLDEPGKRDADEELWPVSRSKPSHAGHREAVFEQTGGVGNTPTQGDHLPADRQHFHPPSATPELIPEDLPPPVSEVLPADWWKMDEESPDPRFAKTSAQESVAAPPRSEETSAGVPGQSDDALEQPPPGTGGPAHSKPLAASGDHPLPGPDSPSIDRGVRFVEAFYRGLGLSAATLSPEHSERLMWRVGKLLRLLTQGTIEVLQARSKLKGEFRLSQTIVRPSENNPLKFSLDADQALRQFFADERPGFMDVEMAFTEALKDIKQHEVAVVAGMRAAFDCLLRKLSPEVVEAAFRASGKRPSKLYLGGKTWDFYQSFYADFKANAGDDFQGIFGEDFVRAYEEQIALLASREKEK